MNNPDLITTNTSQKNQLGSAEEMAQLVKCLMCKLEDPSSIP